MNGSSHSEDRQLLDMAIQGILKSIGAQRVSTGKLGSGPLGGIFEDPLAVVGYAVFETLDELRAKWIAAQEQLAKAISGAPNNMGPKAWDGYLVLATPQRASSVHAAELTAIRSNTRRVRKLVITGSELGDQPRNPERLRYAVHRALAPLRPLSLPAKSGAIDPLGALPTRISVANLSDDDIAAVVRAFVEGRPMIQALHSRLQNEGLES